MSATELTRTAERPQILEGNSEDFYFELVTRSRTNKRGVPNT